METILVALVGSLRQEVDRRSASLLVLLDNAEAFEIINHGILLRSLSDLGVGSTMLQCTCSFFYSRSQKVVLLSHLAAEMQCATQVGIFPYCSLTST